MVILCQINGPSGIKAKEVFFCSSHHAGALLCAGIVNKTRDAFERFQRESSCSSGGRVQEPLFSTANPVYGK